MLVRRSAWTLALATALVSALASALLAGCGDATPLADRRGEDDSYVVVRMDEADTFVLRDGPWEVRDGVWSLGSLPLSSSSSAGGPGLMTASPHRESLHLVTPVHDGSVRVRVESSSEPLQAPSWCEDVAEASLPYSVQRLVMATAGDRSEDWFVGPGPQRVRFCAEGLDDMDRVASAGGPPRGETYPGRVLLQVWPQPSPTTGTARLSSDFARALAD